MELFRRPEVLLWLLAAAAAVAPLLVWAAARKRQALAAFGVPATLGRLYAPETPRRQGWRLVLELAALALFFVALAGPQWGVQLVTSQGRSRQIVVAVDVSLSMLAEDLQPSRMERAKAELAFLIDQLQGDRIGLIAFSGRAQIQCPLTTDRAAARMFLRALRPDMLPEPGTKIDDAVRVAVTMLAPYPGDKALVLLTDGEDHGKALQEATAQAKEAGVKVFALIAGKPEGAAIPLRDASGTLTGYKKDSKGETVLSRPDEASLQQLANDTGGLALRVEAGATTALVKALQELSGVDAAAATRGRYQDRYQWPLALGLLCWLLAWLLPENPPQRRRSRPQPSPAKAALIALLLVSPARGADLVKEGTRLYDKQDYKGAMLKFQEAAREDPSDQEAKFGLAASQYQLEQYEPAAEGFDAVSKAAPRRRIDALNDLGSSLYRQKKFKEAEQAFKDALALDPRAHDIRHNLAVTLLQTPPPPPKPDPKEDKQDKKDPNKDKNQQPPPQGSQPKPKPKTGMSEEDAKRLLQAVREREQEPPRTKAKGGKAKVEVDW